MSSIIWLLLWVVMFDGCVFFGFGGYGFSGFMVVWGMCLSFCCFMVVVLLVCLAWVLEFSVVSSCWVKRCGNRALLGDFLILSLSVYGWLLIDLL